MYITDAFKLISENTAKGVQEGAYMSMRYFDAVNAKKETRTPEEIISHIRKGLRGGETD